MKTVLLMLVLFVFTISTPAQKIKVPVKVKDAFAKLYPNVKSVKWSMENKTEYEAEFKNDNRTTSVNFDKTGKRIETEIDLSKSELPKAVTEYVTKDYKEWSITETSKVIDSKNTTTFEVQVKKDKVRKDLVFDMAGKFIKTEK